MLELTPELAATCNRPVVDHGPPPDRLFLSDYNYEEIAGRLIAENGTGPLWVFAYGSLLWRPAGTVVESRRATAPGWQRSFCLEIRHWRGSPSEPGLMLGLVQGRGCDGMVQRLPDDRRQDELVKLLEREVDHAADLASVRWIDVSTPTGGIRALAFWADPLEHPIFVQPDVLHTASILARACGQGGSGAEYLQMTASRLEELGIRDSYLWQLQQLVANAIKQRHCSPTKSSGPTFC
jgi:cation transport protein ChaC